MEGRKQPGSSSSLASDLFGSRESSSSSSSTRIFGSIFSSSSKAVGRESLHPEVAGKKENSANEVWNSRPRGLEHMSRRSEDETHPMPNADKSSYYQEERVQPCHLSSSIYYGGQDIFSQPQNTQSSGLQSSFEKDGGEDDGSVSRGNWWKGSLYY